MNYFVDMKDSATLQPDILRLDSLNGQVELSNTELVFQGEYATDGQDLLISFEDQSVRIADYFVAAVPADLVAPNGAVIRGADVMRLAQAGVEQEVAFLHNDLIQSDVIPAQATLASEAIGQADTIAGAVTVVRADGTTATLSEGDLVFQNDVVQTAAGSTASLVFIDGTIFTLAQNSRMILDDLVFDPDGTDNSGVFNLIQGGFVFVAGQVARSGGIEVNTPTSTIGIRGTTVEVQIVFANGVTEVLVSLLPDWPDGALGQVQIFDLNGALIATLTDTETSWVISPLAGQTRPIPRADAIQPDSEVLLSQTYDVNERAELRVDAGGEYVIFGGVDQAPGQDTGPSGAAPDSDDGVPGGPQQDGGANTQPDSGPSDGQEDAPPTDPDAPIENELEDADAGEESVDPDTQPDGQAPEDLQGDAPEDSEARGDGQPTDPAGADDQTDDANPSQENDDTGTGSQTEPETGTGQEGEDDASLLNPTLNDTDDVQQATASDAPTIQQLAVLSDTGAPESDGFAADPLLSSLNASLETPDPGLGVGIQTAAFSLNSDPGIGLTSLIDPFAGSTFSDTGTETSASEPPDPAAGTASLSQDSVSQQAPAFQPTASDVGAGLLEDGSVTIDVLAAAKDSGGGDLSVTSVAAPANGTVSINAEGAVIYKPFANFAGTDSFTYTVANPQGNTDTATVNLTIAAVNDAPEPTDDAALTPQNTATVVDALSNDTDVDSDLSSMTVSVQTAPANGVVQVVGSQFVYTPNAGYSGTDNFTYTVFDGQDSSATAGTVTVVVNDPPFANDTTETVDEDGAVAVTPSVDDTEGDPATIIAVSDPANGTAEISGTSVAYTPNPDYFGTDEFTYTVEDANGATSTATVSVTVDPINDDPSASDETEPAVEDTPITFDVLANANDVDGDVVSLVSFTQPSKGVITQEPSGALTYTPNADANGQDSFSYTVTDGIGTPATGLITINVTAVNDAPTADVVAGSSAPEDTSLSVDLSVASGDVDGDTLAYMVGTPGNGSVALTGASVVYTPDPDFNGTDSFTYTVNDGQGGTNTSTVSVTIDPVNDAPVTAPTSVTAIEDTALNFDPRDDVTDVDGDTLTISAVTQPNGGSVVIEADGTLTFTPNDGFNQSTSFTYEVRDSSNAVAQGTVNITITAQNDAPIAVDDLNVSALEDTELTIDVLSNDADPDGDTISLVSVTQPGGGTVTTTPAGLVTYTPDPDANGEDTFTYTITDGTLTDTGTVAVDVAAVNDDPKAIDETFGTAFNTALVLDASQLSGNDTDGDPELTQTLTVTGAEFAVGGTVSLVGGTISFVPNDGVSGNASFDYTINDGAGGTATGTVTVEVAENTSPVASDVTADTVEDISLTRSILGSATDADNQTLTYTLGVPGNGTVAFDGSNALGGTNYVYTPNADFFGTDSFSYSVNDGYGGTDTATVTITVTPVNDDPEPVDDAFLVQVNQDLVIDAQDLLVNDLDVDNPAGDLSVTSVSAPQNGTVALDGTTIIFTPDTNYTGAAGFTYDVADGVGGTNSGSVILSVGGNLAPIAVDDTEETNEDSSVYIDVLLNDSDPDMDTLSFSADVPQNGTFSFDGEGYIYSPNANFNGTDTFSYTLSDGNGGVDTGQVTVTVRPINDDPMAAEDIVTILEDTAVNFDPTANDTDVELDDLTIQSTSNPSNGAVVIETDGSLTYTPNANYAGDDSFFYTVSDGNGGVDTSLVSITVTPEEDAPDAVNDAFATDQNTSVTGNVFADNGEGADSDPEGTELTLVSARNSDDAAIRTDGFTVILGSGATLTLNAEGDFNYDPTGFITTITDLEALGDTETTDDVFTYTVQDAAGAQSTASVTFTVTGINDAPQTQLDQYEPTEDGVVSGNALTDATTGAADFDPEGDAFTITAINGVELADLDQDPITGAAQLTLAVGGKVSVFADGTFSFDTNGDFEDLGDGPGQLVARLVSVQYTATDSNGASTDEALRFFVQGDNDAPVAVDDGTFTTDEDTATTVDVLSNDFDVESDAISVQSVTNGTNGTVSIEANGELTYTPDANFNGTDSFTYTLADGTGLTDEGRVDVTVTPVNDAITLDPVTGDDFIDVAEQLGVTTVTGQAEVNGTAVISFGTASTTVSTDASGAFAANFAATAIPDGASEVTYSVTATDAQGNVGDTATQTVSVEQPSEFANISVAGSTTNYLNPTQPFDINLADFLDEQLFVDTGNGFEIRVPTASATEVRFTDETGKSYAFTGSDLDYAARTGIITGLELGTPTDPDFFQASNLRLPMATLLDAMDNSIVGGALDSTPVSLLFNTSPRFYEGSDQNDWLDYDVQSPLDDVYNGNGGNDELNAGPGDDTINGGADNDFIYDIQGSNVIDGGTGTDEVYYAEAPGAIIADLNAGTVTKTDATIDTVSSVEVVTGSLFNDQISLPDVTSGTFNLVYGLAGADTLSGGAGSNDVVSYARDRFHTTNTTGVMVNLALGLATDLFGDQDILSGFEVVVGSDFDDLLVAADSGTALFGGLGSDTLIGGAGNDFFQTEAGPDVVIYSAGDDVATDLDITAQDPDQLLFSGFALTHFDSLSVSSFGTPGGAGNFGVLLSFDDGAGTTNTLTLQDVTLDEINEYLDFPRFFGSDQDDTIEFATQNGDDLQIFASEANDTYIFSSNAERAYQEIRYDRLGLDGITATLNLAANTASVDKGDAGTDTLIDLPTVARWGFGITGTANNDVYDITYDPNQFGWIGVYEAVGDDVITLTGGSGFLRLNAGVENDVDVVANLTTGDVSTPEGTFAISETGDVSNFQYEIRTGDGNDQVIGTERNDRIILGAGTDTADGLGGSDDIIRYDRFGIETGVTVNLQTGQASGTWNGLAFDHSLSNIEQVRGSVGDDSLTATNASESDLRGNDGNDTLRGGDQRDDLRGGAGDDLLDASAGGAATQGYGDWIEPGTGRDTIIGHQEDWENGGGIDINYDNVDGTGGLVVTLGANGSGTVVSNIADVVNDTFTYANWLRGTADNDLLVGTDTYSGINRSFSLRGGDGDDTVIGGAGRENLEGGDGNDLLDASAGGVELQPNGDYIAPGAGSDTIIGNATTWSLGVGSDLGYQDVDEAGGIVLTVDENGAGTVVSNNPGVIDDTFTFSDFFLATSGNDLLVGSQLTTRSVGWRPLAGDDTIQGGSGTSDQIDYSDSANYEGYLGGITANMITQVILDPFGGTDTFTGIEEIDGTNDADVFIGSDNNNRFQGRGGDDVLSGGLGNDNYDLGDGFDTLTFSGGFDYVDDFNVAEDVLQFSGTALSNIGTLFLNPFDDGTGYSLSFDNEFDDNHDTDFSLSMGSGITLEDVYTILGSMTFTPVDTTGTAGRDVLFGTPENDRINPLSNDDDGDVIYGSAGDDTYTFSDATGTSFYDVAYYRLGPVGLTADIDLNQTNNTIDKGVAGTDTLIDVSTAASAFGFGLSGSKGNDVFNIIQDTSDGESFVSIFLEGGIDTINLEAGFGSLSLHTAEREADVVADLTAGLITDSDGNSATVNVSGDTGNVNRMELRTRNGDDLVTGNDFDNRFILGSGNDTVDGKGGYDGVRYDRNGVDDGVTVSLASGTATGIWDEQQFTHTLTDIEYIRGSNNDDALIASDNGDELDGRNGDDIAIGGAGDDQLRGRGGNDILIGNGGNDAYFGGDGEDVIVFSSGNDFVGDFDVVEDGLVWAGDAKTFASSLNIFDVSGSFGQQVRFEFTDASSALFGIDVFGITVDQANQIVLDMAQDPVVFVGTDGRDNVSGTAGDDYINMLSNTGDGDIAIATAGADEYDLRYSSARGYYGIDYSGVAAAGITADIDFNAQLNTVDKGVDGEDALDGALQAAKGFLFLLGTNANDVFNITGHATDETYLEFGHQGQLGADVINFTPTQGSLRLKMNADQDVVADFSGVDLGGPAIVTSSGGNSQTLNVSGSLDMTGLNVWLGNGNDTFTGSNGSNQVILGGGTDSADAGGGFDTIRYNRSEMDTGVVANLQTGVAIGTYDGSNFLHTLSNFERVRGSDFDDVLTAGDTGGHTLEGRGGDDLLRRADFDEGWTDGDGGRDTLEQTASGSFDFSAINVGNSYRDIEVLSFENSGTDVATLSLQNVIDFSSTADSLLENAFGGDAAESLSVVGDVGDTVRFADGTVAQNGTVNDSAGRTLDVYQFTSGADILAVVAVDQDVSVETLA